MQWLLEYELWFRLTSFLGLLALFLAWELYWPRRGRERDRRSRWTTNGLIIALDTVILRLLFPTAAVGAALWTNEYQVGLLQWLAAPWWVALLLGVVLLDLVVWAQHLLFHQVPWLWRFHRMHHTDVDLDTTSGLRFHPVEMVLSMLIKIGAVVALGVPAAAVILFEVLLNATSLFNHSNIRIGQRLDAVLRYLVVTPDMHRVHHSVKKWETNSNYGFNLPWWDRLFGTYRAQPEDGHQGMQIGLEYFRASDDNRFRAVLLQPFKEPQRSVQETPQDDE